jgi:DNA-binding CsgD family transcriptional regulator
MVGRDLERGRLGQLLERTLAGQGGLVMVSGESGVGKTRLAEELAAEAARVRALALTGHCYEMEEAPYVPFAEILYSALRGPTEEQFREALVRYGPDVAKLMPEMRRVFPDIPPPLQLPPEQERRYLFDSLCELLEQASRTQPLLLILEDLHWSDSSTLTLLQHLARRLRVMQVLVLGTFRDPEPDKSGAFESALAELFRHRLAERVVLKRLPEGEVKALLEALGGPDVPDPVVRAIYDETEGNAFFVEEAFKHLAEEGKLFDAIGNWLPGIELSEGDVPDNVRLVVGRRFQRLSDLCREILTHAAVIGREFEARLLEVVAGRDREAVLQVIEEAERAHVLRAVRDRERRFAFAHELIRQTVLSEVSTIRRQRLHLQVATAIERLYLPAGRDAQSLEEHASSLAYHFIQAGPGGDVDKAIDYAGRAAKQAASQLAFEEAAQFYQKALEALESKAAVDETPRCQLLLSLGEAKNWAGDWQGGKHAFLKAADLARHSQAPEQLARAALGVAGTAHGAAINQPAVDLLEEALDTLGAADNALRARVLARLAVELYYIDPEGRRAALSREAIEMARRLENPATLAYVLGAASWGLWRPDNVEERLALAREMIPLAEEVGDRETALRGRSLVLSSLLELRDIHGFEIEIEAVDRLAHESRQPIWIWSTLTLRAAQALFKGRFEEGERLAQQALAAGQEGRAPNAFSIFCLQMFWLRTEQARVEEAEPLIKRFADRALGVALWQAALACLYWEAGRTAEARSEFEALAKEDFTLIPQDAFWLMVIALLSEACSYIRDTTRAAALYSLLLPYAEHNIVFAAGPAVWGSAARYLGLLAVTMCRWQEAEKHFAGALEMNTRMGAKPWVAWTQYDYGKMLLNRRQPGDRKKAHGLLNEALDTAQALGMKRLNFRVTALLGSGRHRTSIYPDGLTQREVEVLRLIAAGRSSREISAELVLSVRTVERHITNIYAKINARSRAQATAYALARGLWTPVA